MFIQPVSSRRQKQRSCYEATGDVWLCGRLIRHVAVICGTVAHCNSYADWYFVLNERQVWVSQSGREHVKYHLQTIWASFNLSMISEVEWKGLPSPHFNHFNAYHHSTHFILRENVGRTIFLHPCQLFCILSWRRSSFWGISHILFYLNTFLYVFIAKSEITVWLCQRSLTL